MLFTRLFVWRAGTMLFVCVFVCLCWVISVIVCLFVLRGGWVGVVVCLFGGMCCVLLFPCLCCVLCCLPVCVVFGGGVCLFVYLCCVGVSVYMCLCCLLFICLRCASGAIVYVFVLFVVNLFVLGGGCLVAAVLPPFCDPETLL